MQSGSMNARAVRIAAERHEGFWRRVEKTDAGCWLWKGTRNAGGYGVTWDLQDNGGKRYHVGAHRAAYAIIHGECPAGMVVMHTCDVRACVNPDHLRLGTQRDNVQDAVKKGRATGRALRIEAQRKLQQEDAIKYLDYLHANLCGFAKALNLGPMPYDFETWRKARYGMEKSA